MIFFSHPSVQITKGTTGENGWPVCDLSLMWWCDHCFGAAAFHRRLSAAHCSVAAFVLLTLYLILSVRVSGMRLFRDFCENNYRCLHSHFVLKLSLRSLSVNSIKLNISSPQKWTE